MKTINQMIQQAADEACKKGVGIEVVYTDKSSGKEKIDDWPEKYQRDIKIVVKADPK